LAEQLLGAAQGQDTGGACPTATFQPPAIALKIGPYLDPANVAAMPPRPADRQFRFLAFARNARKSSSIFYSCKGHELLSILWLSPSGAVKTAMQILEKKQFCSDSET
jgi:hypothetical protein